MITVKIMDQQQLLRDIEEAYDEQGLLALCARLNIEPETLESEEQVGLARGLLRVMRQRGRLAELVRLLVEQHPQLAHRYQLYLNRDKDEAPLTWIDELSDDTSLTWQWSTEGRELRQLAREQVYLPPPVPSTQDLHPTFNWPDSSTPTPTPTPPTAAAETAEATNGQPSGPVIDNPYLPGQPVTNLHMFFGRQRELAALRQTVLQGRHTAIVGPERIGKSSLQYALIRGGFPAEAHLLLSWIDLKDDRAHTRSGLLNTIWQQWWRQIRPDTSPALADLDRFAAAAGKLKVAGFQPMLCLDGLEQLLERPEEFGDPLFEVWHELAAQGKIRLVTTSQRPLADLFRQADMGTKFYSLFQQLDLGLLEEQAARDLLTIPAQQRGLAIPAGAVSHLLQLCGPHPLYLQIAGKFLFDGLAVRSYSWATVREQFTRAAEPHWQALWQSLTPLAQQHFPLKESIPATTIAIRQCRQLAARGVVIQEGERFRPFSEGFAFWVRAMRKS